MLTRLNTVFEPSRIFNTATNPLLVTCDDFEDWICKHCRQNKSILFNEYIASRFALLWKIKTPEICYIIVKDEHIPVTAQPNLPKKFFVTPCFGSRYIDASIEINNSHISTFQSNSFKEKIKDKVDFLIIALFDIWLSNEDRNHNNPNLLINISDKDSYYFYAIDHDMIFNGNNLEKGLYLISEDESLISTDLATILFADDDHLEALVTMIIKKFYLCVEKCKDQLPNLLEDVPQEWQLNNAHLNSILKQNLFKPEWLSECEKFFLELIQTYLKK